MIPELEMIARIAFGGLLGGMIGFERHQHRRPAGLRTHLIVALAAATFMVISSQFVYYQNYTKDGLVEVDASRIAASVVSGIGFLAGGAILRTGFTIQGLTTAAGLWLVTAIGMCAGAGMYNPGIAVTMMGLGVLTVLRRFEDKEDHMLRFKLSLILEDGAVRDRLHAALKELEARATEIEYERRNETPTPRIAVVLEVKLFDSVGMKKLIQVVESVSGVLCAHIQMLEGDLPRPPKVEKIS